MIHIKVLLCIIKVCCVTFIRVSMCEGLLTVRYLVIQFTRVYDLPSSSDPYTEEEGAKHHFLYIRRPSSRSTYSHGGGSKNSRTLLAKGGKPRLGIGPIGRRS